MAGKILIIGNFGYANGKIDGQTIKTRNVYRLITDRHICSVSYFDTSYKHINPKQLIKLFIDFISSPCILYLPGQKSLKLLFPLIFILCKISRKSLVYVVIGGWLPSFIKDKKHLMLMLKRIDDILLETSPMKFRLDSLYNFKNVQVLPNFRIHDYKPIIQKGNGPLKCVFMSRIVKEKGIDVIFRFVESLTSSGRAGLITVDFFGPIETKDEKYFLEKIEKLSSLKYKGVLSEESIHKTLNDYDILLLPTRYPGEGFPGAILDAYIAGIPVIVSDWKDISSFVEHDVTGFIFDLNKELDFGELLLDLNNNREKLNYFKVNAHNKSEEYSIDNCWNIIENCFKKLK